MVDMQSALDRESFVWEGGVSQVVNVWVFLLSLTLGGTPIDLTGFGGGSGSGSGFPLFNFVDGETYTFSMTWGELVEVVQQRKLRVKGVGKLNP